MRDEPISDPDIENLGPAMLALTVARRRFVVGWIGTKGKNAARVARSAGFSAQRAKVTACELLRDPKILAALKEEADRRLDGIAVLAILGLGDLVTSKNEKVKAAAVDSVLDRTGYGRRSTQDVRVEHVDSRSTAELLAAVQAMMGPKALPVIDTTAEKVAVNAEG